MRDILNLRRRRRQLATFTHERPRRFFRHLSFNIQESLFWQLLLPCRLRDQFYKTNFALIQLP